MSSNRAFSAIGRKKTEFSANLNDRDASSSSGDEEKKRYLTSQFEPVEEEEVQLDTDRNSLAAVVVVNNNVGYATLVP